MELRQKGRGEAEGVAEMRTMPVKQLRNIRAAGGDGAMGMRILRAMAAVGGTAKRSLKMDRGWNAFKKKAAVRLAQRSPRGWKHLHPERLEVFTLGQAKSSAPSPKLLHK